MMLPGPVSNCAGLTGTENGKGSAIENNKMTGTKYGCVIMSRAGVLSTKADNESSWRDKLLAHAVAEMGLDID